MFVNKIIDHWSAKFSIPGLYVLQRLFNHNYHGQSSGQFATAFDVRSNTFRSIERCRVNGYDRWFRWIRSSSLTLLRKFLKKKKKSLYLSRDSRADRHEIPKRDTRFNRDSMSRCIDAYLVIIRFFFSFLSLSLSILFLTGIRRPCYDLLFDDNGSWLFVPEPFNKRDHCLISAWFLVIWRPNSLVAVPTPERPSARNWSPVPSINQAR